jgi:hypothetical protein
MSLIKKILIPSLLGVLAIITTASAADFSSFTDYWQSNHSPDRTEIEYIDPDDAGDGMAGLEYTSFNNFYNNYYLDQVKNAPYDYRGREGREVKLLNGYNCKDEACPAFRGRKLFNTPAIDADCPEDGDCTFEQTEDGDTILFEVYYHNNADDPYDGGIYQGSIAQNAKIGVNLNENSDFWDINPDDPYALMRPRSFITADNNYYYTDPRNPGSSERLTYPDGIWAGDPIRTVSDDMQLLVDKEANPDFELLSLEIDPTEMWLVLSDDANATGMETITYTTPDSKKIELIKGNAMIPGAEDITWPSTTITYTTDTGPVSVVVTPHMSLDSKTAWVHFDKVPGCFRYAGFLYIKANVTKEIPPQDLTNKCKQLTFQDPSTGMEPVSTCDIVPNKTEFTLRLTMEDAEQLPPSQYSYVTIQTQTDAYGRLGIEQGDGSVQEINPINPVPVYEFPKKYVIPVRSYQQEATDGMFYINGIYEGLGALDAYFSDANGEEILRIDFDSEGDLLNIEYGSNKACKGYTPTCDDTCSKLITNAPSVYPVGSLSEMQAQAQNYYNNGPWESVVYYGIAKGHGSFFSNPEDLFVAYPDAYLNYNLRSVQDHSLNIPLEPSFFTNILYDTLFLLEEAFGGAQGGNEQASLMFANAMLALNPFDPGTIGEALEPLDPFSPDLPAGIQYFIDPAVYDIYSANHWEPVWLYAEQEGAEVIAVEGYNTDYAACQARFDITAPRQCSEIDFSTQAIGGEDTPTDNPTCLDTGERLLVELDDITLDDGYQVDIYNDDYIIEWSTTPAEEGLFWDLATGESGNPFQSSSYQIVYSGNAEVHAELISVGGVPEESTVCKWEKDVPLCEYGCADLDIQFQDGTDTMFVGEDKYFDITVTGTDGNDYPTDIRWSSLVGGNLRFNGAYSPIDLTQYPHIYESTYPDSNIGRAQEPTRAGTILAEAVLASKVCRDTLNVTWPDNVCENLTYTATNKDGGVYTNPAGLHFEEETIQQVVADNEPLLALDGEITYSEDYAAPVITYSSDYGCFREGMQPLGAGGLPVPWWIPSGECLPELTASQDTRVFFYPDADLLASPTGSEFYEDVIVMTAYGSDPDAEPDCTKTISFHITRDLQTCESIALRSDPSPFTAADPTHIHVIENQSALGEYTGDFYFRTDRGQITNLATNNTAPGLHLDFATSIDPNNEVYLIGGEPAPGQSTTLLVEAVDEGGEACVATLTYTEPIIPPEACISLDIISPPNGFTVDETTSEDVEIAVVGNPEEYTYHWETHNNQAAYWDKQGTTSGVGYQFNTVNLLTAGTCIEVYVEGYTEGTACWDQVCSRTKGGGEGEGETDPKLNKWVSLKNEDDFETTINIDMEAEAVEYKIKFEAGSKTKSVDIKDSAMTERKIYGTKGGYLEYTPPSLEITHVRSENPTKMLTESKYCEYVVDEESGDIDLESNEPCLGRYEDNYNGHNDVQSDWVAGKYIFITNLKKNDDIEITYSMFNHTAIDEEFCRELNPAIDGCGEEFVNKAESQEYKDEEGTKEDEHDTDSTKVIITCPYILTRTSGDTFFNSDLATGADVAYCAPQKNIVGPIIKPRPPREKTVTSTGQGDAVRPTVLSIPSHNICKFSNVPGYNSLPGYDNPLKNFSSTICEMEAEVAEEWTKAYVVNSITSNVEKITFWNKNQTQPTLSSSPAETSNRIYKWEDSDLTIEGSNGDPFVVDQFAQTYIITGSGDLHITSDIVYDQANILQQILKPKTVPSAAFIVLDGDIIIDSDVKELWGTFIAVNGEIKADGKVSKTQLIIHGSLIGDVTDLFSNRQYVGNINKDEGSVTIKYIENILLNTPPGLSQLMDVTRLRVTN